MGIPVSMEDTEPMALTPTLMPTTARGPLRPSPRPRLTPLFCMAPMAMVPAPTTVSMEDTGPMVLTPTPMDTTARGPLRLSPRPRLTPLSSTQPPSPLWPPPLSRLSSPLSPPLSTPTPTPMSTARGPLMLRLTPLSSTLLVLLPLPTPTTPSPPPLSPPTPSLWPPLPRPPPMVSPPPMLDSSTLPTLESASTTLVSRSPAKQYNNFHITK